MDSERIQSSEQSAKPTVRSLSKRRQFQNKNEEFSVDFLLSEYPNKTSFKERFSARENIGVGGQARIKQAIDMRTNQMVALKIFKKNKMTLLGLNQAYDEYSFSQKLKHPNILQQNGYFEDSNFICIVYELMQTDLREYFSNFDVADLLSENNVRKLFYQMAQSIAYCHKNDVIHRDVKLENFLIRKTSNGKFLVKLSDFGIACHYNKDTENEDKSGSLLGVAPEIFTSNQFCPKIDCWGLGVILYELLTTLHPFQGKDFKDIMSNITKEDIDYENEEIWNNISEEAKDLVNKLLQKDPQKRISSEEILSHPWFKEMEQDNFEADDVSYYSQIEQVEKVKQMLAANMSKYQSFDDTTAASEIGQKSSHNDIL